MRRVRLLFGGRVAKNVTFFVEAGPPNLGKALPEGKNIQPAVIVQDAFVYPGTYLGTKKIVAVGAAFDRQSVVSLLRRGLLQAQLLSGRE